MLEALGQFCERPLPASLVLVGGFALLIAGGHWLVDGAVAVARRLGWPTLLIGLTLVAFGTSAPELSFNVIAAVGGNADLSFGNVVGSNFANIGLILGLSALLKPLGVHGRVVNTELPQLAIVTVITAGLALLPLITGDSPGFGRVAGLVLLVMFSGFLLAWYRLGSREARDPLVRELGHEAEQESHKPMPLAAALVLFGLAALVVGGKLAEAGAVGLAGYLGLSKALIGLTLVAVATSLPELATSLIACRKGHDDLAVGNVVGSNLFNLLLVLGATSTIEAVPVPMPWGWWDLVVMTAITLLLLPISLSNRHRVTRAEGGLLLLIYLGYMAWGVARELTAR